MEVKKGSYRCDLCQTAPLKDTQVIVLAAGDKYEHLCWRCLWGWVGVCVGCNHSFPREELNVEGRCKTCA